MKRDRIRTRGSRKAEIDPGPGFLLKSRRLPIGNNKKIRRDPIRGDLVPGDRVPTDLFPRDLIPSELIRRDPTLR